MKAWIMTIALASALALAGCQEGPVEDAGERVDEAVENAADAVENTAEDAADAVEDAADRSN